MKKLVIKKLENAYGIKELKVSFDDNTLSQNLVYSKNGTFKTSFSRCLYNLSNNEKEKIEDRITKIPANIEMKMIDDEGESNNLINKFLVFSREIYEEKSLSDYEKELEMLTIDKRKQEYVQDLINSTLEEPIAELQINAKSINLNLQKALETLNIPYKGKLDWYLEVFKYIDGAPDENISEINLKTIFQKTYDILDNDNFQENINNYINIYNKKIKAELFDDDFDENSCISFLESLKKTKFMNEDKKRGVILNGTSYYDYDSVQEIINKTMKNISSSPEILKSNQELIKSMGTSNEAQKLKKEIINNPLLIKQLSLGRKKIIRIALKNSGLQTKYWINILENAMSELKKIYDEVQNMNSKFEKAIEIYKLRFRPVFDIKIKNKKESMLGLDLPSLYFKYKKYDCDIEEKFLYDILSSGEKTSLNIIKFIVEYISNKDSKPFIILDDIVETFDYANRYAFIEYINDMVNDDTPVIVLTHNFEFYRTLHSRIKKLVPLVTNVDEKGRILIQECSKINRNIEDVLNVQSKKELFFAIPYLREAKMILQDNNEILNACLHYKEKTLKLILKDIMNLFPKKIKLDIDPNLFYLDELENVLSSIKMTNNYDLVEKTIYSIGCRVFLEQKIIQKNFDLIKDVNENQFAYIIKKYHNQLNEKVLELAERVSISTPEFIHGNAFMYEPLIDIDGFYLKELYDDIKKLNIDSIWK